MDGKYHFEIGGKDKGFNQIADLLDSYIFADDIETPIGPKLPLWMLFFLHEHQITLNRTLSIILLGRIEYAE